MKYLNDFESMRLRKFVKSDDFRDIYRSDLAYDIDRLYDEITTLKIEEIQAAIKVLRIMTELACYKSVLDMKVTINEIKDAKYEDNKYLQARGAVYISKGLRYTEGFYLGRKKEQSDGEILIDQYNDGRYEVMNRMLNRLKHESGL